MKTICVIALILVGSTVAQAPPQSRDLRDLTFVNLPSLKEIHNEGPCDASWAITVATVANDEWAVAYKNNALQNGKRFSYQNIMECCSACWQGFKNGCMGGSHKAALKFLQTTGTVTGGKPGQNTDTLCMAYKMKDCNLNPDFGGTTCAAADLEIGTNFDKCNKVCDKNTVTYASSNIKITSFENIEVTPPNYAANIEAQISNNKIVIAEMILFEDIYSMKPNDIYIHTWGRAIGTVVVGIYGFGNDSTTGLNFWLVRLPFGPNFAKQTESKDQGYIKVHRGSNNNGLENEGGAYTITVTAIPPPA